MSLWTALRSLLGRPSAGAPAQRKVSYAPSRNGAADPGEVVWATIAFEDGSGSKDRPVLVVGRKGRGTVLALQLSTQEKRAHQNGWLPLGVGPWDRRPARRPPADRRLRQACRSSPGRTNPHS